MNLPKVKKSIFALLSLAAVFSCSPNQEGVQPREFAAHRGVNLNGTIAGENSLESIVLAHKAGFRVIETDVWYTADSALVIRHDPTLDRTCLTSDGEAVTGGVAIRSLTLKQLRENYVQKADDPAMRTPVPTLEEFLAECQKYGLFVLIQPKERDASGKFFHDVIAVADKYLGRDSYAMSSENFAARYIRTRHEFDNVKVMPVLHGNGDNFDEIARMGNAIMDMGSYPVEKYPEMVAKAAEKGIPCMAPNTLSHHEFYDVLSTIDPVPFAYVFSDVLAPDYHGQGKTVWTKKYSGKLKEGKAIGPWEMMPEVRFGGIYLEMEITGDAVIRIGERTQEISSAEPQVHRFQFLCYKEHPVIDVTGGKGGVVIRGLKARLVDFD